MVRPNAPDRFNEEKSTYVVRGEGEGADKPDLEHTNQPDLIGQAIANLLDRVDKLEFQVVGHVDEFHLHSTAAGVWEELEDYSI